MGIFDEAKAEEEPKDQELPDPPETTASDIEGGVFSMTMALVLQYAKKESMSAARERAALFLDSLAKGLRMDQQNSPASESQENEE